MQQKSENKPTSAQTENQEKIQKQEQQEFRKIPLKFIEGQSFYLNSHSKFNDQIGEQKHTRKYNVALIKQLLIQGKLLKKFDLVQLIECFRNVIKNQSNMVKINGNVTVVGDIHGQFYDFMKAVSLIKVKYNDLLQDFKSGNVLFLGDYVDRGYFSIQVITFIMLLKVNNPNHIYCLRGNHQCRTMTIVYNFKAQCLVKYDQQVYDLFMQAFDLLPVAAVINNSFFCVHGGISNQLTDISKIDQLDRFKQIPEQGVLCDFMWSDPLPKGRNKMYQQFEFNDTRMCSIYFGNKLANKFLQKNNLKTILRAHQVFPEGFQRRDWSKKNKNIPTVITIFSAPNYCGIYNNYGAILHIQDNKFEVRQYKEQSIKKKIKTFVDVFQWSMPQVIRIINQFTKNMINSISFIYLPEEMKQFEQAPIQEKLAALLNYYNKYLKNRQKQRIGSEDSQKRMELKQLQNQKSNQSNKIVKQYYNQPEIVNIENEGNYEQIVKKDIRVNQSLQQGYKPDQSSQALKIYSQSYRLPQKQAQNRKQSQDMSFQYL